MGVLSADEGRVVVDCRERGDFSMIFDGQAGCRGLAAAAVRPGRKARPSVDDRVAVHLLVRDPGLLKIYDHLAGDAPPDVRVLEHDPRHLRDRGVRVGDEDVPVHGLVVPDVLDPRRARKVREGRILDGRIGLQLRAVLARGGRFEREAATVRVLRIGDVKVRLVACFAGGASWNLKVEDGSRRGAGVVYFRRSVGRDHLDGADLHRGRRPCPPLRNAKFEDGVVLVADVLDRRRAPRRKCVDGPDLDCCALAPRPRGKRDRVSIPKW